MLRIVLQCVVEKKRERSDNEYPLRLFHISFSLNSAIKLLSIRFSPTGSHLDKHIERNHHTFYSGLVRSNRCTLDADVVLQNSICSIDSDLIVRGIAMFNAQVIVINLDLQEGQNKLLVLIEKKHILAARG